MEVSHEVHFRSVSIFASLSLLYKRGTLLPLVDQCILIVSPTEITKITKGPSQVCITVNFIRNHGMHVTRQHRRELH